jgi:hypothetical protein
VKRYEINSVDRHVVQETLAVLYRLFFLQFMVSFICSRSGNILCELSKNFSVYFEGGGDHLLRCCWRRDAF